MKSEKNNHLIAIVVGISLIVFVVIITFVKSSLNGENVDQKNKEEIKKITDETKNVKYFTTKELLKKISSGESVVLIDIRTPEEFQIEHLQNSINIPLSTLEATLPNLRKGALYVLIDNSNTLELLDLAGNIFPKNDFDSTFYLQGGITEWKNNFAPTISGGNPNSISDQAKVNYLSSDKLKEVIEKEKNFLIIDVRQKSNFVEGHIKGAINLYLGDIEGKISEIPLGKKVIVYDDDTISAFQAAVRLSDLGRANVFSLSDGFGKWKEKNYPIEK